MTEAPGSGVPRIRLFISSPADVLPERAIADRVVARLDGLWQSHVRLSSERWERRFYEASISFQAALGTMAGRDVVIGILWKRIGSPLPPDVFRRADGSAYESGTAFELETALDASEQSGKPAVYLFRKTAPVEFNALTVEDERRQYDTLLHWWERTTSDEAGHFRRGYQTYSTLEEFEDSLTKLVEDHLRKEGLIPTGAAWDIRSKGSPYPGLLPYDSSYASVFFGRSLAIAEALTEIKEAAGRDAPVLLIVGPSGSGKSSLALAGLVPNLTGSTIHGVDFWRTLLIEPSPDPVLGLAQRLYAANALPELKGSPYTSPESFATLARQSAEAAAQVVKWGLEKAGTALQEQVGGGRIPSGRLLVYVDQLETALDAENARGFAGILRELVATEAAWLIASLRSDRYGDLQRDPDYLELRRRSALFDLPPPGSSEIADIIVGPAHAAGLVFEERNNVSLAKVIRSEVTAADALPLLQMTLARLFEKRRDATLTYAAYEEAGGLEGAIASHAENVFATASPAARGMLDSLLQKLVADIDDAGRLTVRTLELSSWRDPALRELVDKMTEARLLVNAAGSVRIAHEALLRRWKRAAESPALQPEVIRLRRQITPNLELWSNTNSDSDLLQPGTALAAAEKILREHPGSLPRELEDYIALSASAAAAHASAETRKARHRTYAATAVAALLAIFAFMIFRLYADASHNFVLALLTRANDYLVAEKPTRALVLASALGKSSLLDRALAPLGLSSADSDEAVRIKSIAQVTGPASSAPLWTLVRSSPINAAAFNNDGTAFAIGYADGRTMIFPSDGSGRRRDLLGQKGRVWAVKFSPGGKKVATATSDEVVLWDLEAGRGRSLCVGAHQVSDVAYDPKGRYVAWSSRDGEIAVWDVQNNVPLRSFPEHRGWALAVEFSADGELLASSGDDGTIVIRRVADWSIFKVLRTGRADLLSISFRPDARVIATAALAGPIDVWNVENGEAKSAPIPIPAKPNKRWKVKFSPDGAWLAVASWDGTISFWDGQSFRHRGTIDGNDERINDVSFSPNSKWLLSGDESGTTRLWDLATVKPMFEDAAADTREALVGRYSADGSKFAAGGKDGVVTLFRVDSSGRLAPVCTIKHKNWVSSVSFSADGSRIASVGMSDAPPSEDERENQDGIIVSETDTCAPVGSPINVHHAFIRAVAFDPAANMIAWSTRSGEIWLADHDRHSKPVMLPQTHTDGVEEIDFSASGRFLASAGRDGRVVVWNVASRNVERVLRETGPGLFTIRFAADEKTLASGGAQDWIEVWDLSRQRGSELVTKLPVIGGSNRLAFKTDGSMLAVGSDDRYISMWAAPGWNKIFQLESLVGVRSVYGFHPKRGDLAFDGEAGLVRILREEAPVSGAAQSGTLSGMDVFFDRMPSNVPDDAPEVVKLEFDRCTSR
jgi:WD40 repeat protein